MAIECQLAGKELLWYKKAVRKKFLYFYVFLFLILFIFGGFYTGGKKWNGIKISPTSAPTIAQTQESEVSARVAKVIDGDTIKVFIGDKEETVRLIGIDAPETVDPEKSVQCFGKEAGDKAKNILTNKVVNLVSDSTQGERDKYGRLLRYVFLNGVNFDELMITDGYAREYTYKNNPYKYSEEFKTAQKQARENKVGLWADGACNN
jgi:micrococcal nuclease